MLGLAPCFSNLIIDIIFIFLIRKTLILAQSQNLEKNYFLNPKN